MVERQHMQCDHDCAGIPNVANLSKFKVAAIFYIAGYVGKMADKQTNCMTKSKALGSTKSVKNI